MTATTLLATALAAVAASGAVAVEPASGWRVERATAVASAVWHDRCDGHVSVVRGDVGPVSKLGEVAAYAQREQCRVVLRPDVRYTWSALCTLMIHEVGHLAGHEHSDNPLSVMYPALGGWVEDRTAYVEYADPRCDDRGRPYLERRGRLRPARAAKRHR